MGRVKTLEQDQAIRVIGMVISFLSAVLTATGARRVVGAVLIAAGVPCERVAELTGSCYRSIRELRSKLESEEQTESIFDVGGGGRNKKTKDVESKIFDEIENGNYHSQQEIVDMIADKYGIKVHRSSVSRLVKKTASDA